MKKRVFLGTNDPQKIVLHPVFYGSLLSVICPIEAFSASETYLYVEGPSAHLKFLFPYLVQLVKQAPVDATDTWGTWTGVEGCDQTGKLTLFYHHGAHFSDHLILLEHCFRRDIVFYCDLRLSLVSFLEVYCQSSNRIRWYHKFILAGLPEELEQNGTIEFPLLQNI